MAEAKDQTNERVLKSIKEFCDTERELIQVLRQVNEHRVFVKMGYSSLFDYVVRSLELPEARARRLIANVRSRSIS